MKRSFVEPQMKVMAVNMKENIACSKDGDEACTDSKNNLVVGIKGNQTLTVHVKNYGNKQIFDTAYNYTGQKKMSFS